MRGWITGLVGTVVLFAGVLFNSVPADAAVQWSSSVGGNDHWYEVVTTPSPTTMWEQGRVAAESSGGYLATLVTEPENDWVTVNVLRPAPHHMYAIGGLQPIGSPEPDGGWRWITGEPWSYTNWASYPSQEPNDGWGANENRLTVFGGGYYFNPDNVGKWNDYAENSPNLSGYVVEYNSEPPAIPEPSTIVIWSLLAGLGISIGWRRRRWVV